MVEKDDLDDVFDSIERNRNNRLSGQWNAIPFINKKAFSRFIPGIQKGRYYIVAGPQKSGKSSLTDDLFLYNVMTFIRENPDSTITVKIKYFSLELSKEQKILALISRVLFDVKDIVISPEDLLSLFEDNVLDLNRLEEVKEIAPLLRYILDRVEFIEDVRNPWGIMKNVENYMATVGKFTYKTIDFDNGKGPQKVKDKYIEDDPNHYVIIITDHLSLLKTEKAAPTIKQAIDKFSSDYCIEMRNKYNCVVVNVQQMSAQSQTKEYFRGEAIIDKLRPAPSDLAESRITGRDANVLIALFNPFLYDIKNIDGYNVCENREGLMDNYRQVIILLNRNGRSNASFNMFFAGAVSFFKELPPANSPAMESVKLLTQKVRQ